MSWDRVQAEVDGYMLSFASADGTSQEVFVGADTTYKLIGLKPGVIYTIHVWAIKGSRASKKTSTEAETGLPFFLSFLSLQTCPALGSQQHSFATATGNMTAYLGESLHKLGLTEYPHIRVCLNFG